MPDEKERLFEEGRESGPGSRPSKGAESDREWDETPPRKPSQGSSSLTPDQIEELQRSLDPNRIQRRAGFRGQQLEYLPVHDIVETANRIFGFGGWQREIRRLENVFEEETEGLYSVGYLCEYRIGVGEILHEDVGFGSSTNQHDLAQAHEMAVKAAVSDALKRCFRAFGDQFGLSLYRKHEYEEPATGGPRTATEAQLARLRKTLRSHDLTESSLLEYINTKMGSDLGRLEELPLKIASRAIERFVEDEESFVKEIGSIAGQSGASHMSQREP